MASAQAGSVNQQELWFLILQHVSASPLAHVLPVLEAELHAHRLLPERYTITGSTESLTFAQLREQNSHLPSSHLTDLLAHYNSLKDARNTGVKGAHSLLRSINSETAERQPHASSANRRAVLLPPGPGPHAKASLACRQILLESGECPHAVRPHSRVSNELWSQRLHHLRTFRGHTAPVYCVTTTDRYVITGSDDCLVKIWCVTTGVLLMACRGHEAEVTDAKISCDGRYLASAAQDNVIRVWSLEDGKLGHPVSVLLGCEKIVTFLHWNPVVPNVLASVSADGACRVWDVHGTDPVPLRPSPTFGRRASNVPLSARAMRAAANVDPASGVPMAAGQGPDGEVEPFGLLCCVWSPDGRFLVAGGNNCIAYMWHWSLAAPQMGDGPERDTWIAALQTLQPMTEGERRRSGLLTELARKDWPIIHEQCQLVGHRNNIPLVKFSRDGRRLATASADGTVRIFTQVVKRGEPTEQWSETCVLSNQPIQNKNLNAQRRRKGPAIPNINQLEWSLDDDLIVVALSDSSIRVWDPAANRELHCLTGHSKDLYEISFHPTMPNLAASWAHDGVVILWNVATGKKLQEFSSKKTYPGKGRWADALMLLDGGWDATGSRLFVTDTSGQFHIYGLGPADICSRAHYDQFWKSDYAELGRDPHGWVIDTASNRAPHLCPDRRVGDWFNTPYDEPYQTLSLTNQLSKGVPVRDWRRGPCPRGVLSVPPVVTAAENDARSRGGGDVAVQNAVERVTRAQDELMDRIRSGAVPLSDDDDASVLWVEPARALNPVLLTGVIPRGGRSEGGAGASAAPGGAAAPPRPRPPAASRAQGVNNFSRDAMLPTEDIISDDDDPGISSSDNQGDDDYGDGAAQADTDDQSCSLDSEDADSDDVEESPHPNRPSRSSRAAGASGGGGAAAGGGANATSRAARAAARDDGRAARAATRAARAAPVPRDRQPSRRMLEFAEFEEIRRSTRARDRNPVYDDDAEPEEDEPEDDHDDEDEEEEDEDEEDEEEYLSSDDSRGARRAAPRQRVSTADRSSRRDRRERTRGSRDRERTRARAERRTRASHDREQPERRPREPLDIPVADRRTRSSREADVPERRTRARAASEQQAGRERERRSAREAPPTAAEPSQPPPRPLAPAPRLRALAPPRNALDRSKREEQRARSRRAGRSIPLSLPVPVNTPHEPRQEDTYMWLQQSEHTPVCYVPQIGDQVVYCREGHQNYLTDQQDKLSLLPWQQLPPPPGNAASESYFRAFEPCSVERMEYIISDDGLRYTLARLHLQLLDPQHEVFRGLRFTVDLPPPIAGHVEFVVLRSRFEDGCLQGLVVGARFQSFQTDGETIGKWYRGQIASDELPAEQAESLTSDTLWKADRLWNRYKVTWDPRDGDSQEEDDLTINPWEMYPENADEVAIKRSFQNHDEALREVCLRVEAACTQLNNLPAFERLQLAPSWDEKYRVGNQRYPYNQRVPLPFGFLSIMSRAGSHYYRSLAQLEMDINLISDNPHLLWHRKHDTAVLSRQVRRFLMAAVQGKPGSLEERGSSEDESVALSDDDRPARRAAGGDEAGPSNRRASERPPPPEPPSRDAHRCEAGPSRPSDNLPPPPFGAAAGSDAPPTYGEGPRGGDASPSRRAERPSRGVKRLRMDGADLDPEGDSPGYDPSADAAAAGPGGSTSPTPAKRRRSQPRALMRSKHWGVSAGLLSDSGEAARSVSGALAFDGGAFDGGAFAGGVPPEAAPHPRKPVKVRIKSRAMNGRSDGGGAAAAAGARGGAQRPDGTHPAAAPSGLQNQETHSNMGSRRGAAAPGPRTDVDGKRARRRTARLSPRPQAMAYSDSPYEEEDFERDFESSSDGDDSDVGVHRGRTRRSAPQESPRAVTTRARHTRTRAHAYSD